MLRLIISALSLTSSFHQASAFVPSNVMPSTTCLNGKKDAGDEVVQQVAFAAGSFVEFAEKKRVHIGKIDAVEHKSSGGARYS